MTSATSTSSITVSSKPLASASSCSGDFFGGRPGLPFGRGAGFSAAGGRDFFASAFLGSGFWGACFFGAGCVAADLDAAALPATAGFLSAPFAPTGFLLGCSTDFFTDVFGAGFAGVFDDDFAAGLAAGFATGLAAGLAGLAGGFAADFFPAGFEVLLAAGLATTGFFATAVGFLAFGFAVLTAGFPAGFFAAGFAAAFTTGFDEADGLAAGFFGASGRLAAGFFEAVLAVDFWALLTGIRSLCGNSAETLHYSKKTEKSVP